MRLRQKRLIYIALFAVLLTGLFTFGRGGAVRAMAADPTPTPTPTPMPIVPVLIVAEYTGETVVVGEKIPIEDLHVLLYYNDGSDETLTRDDYILSDETVKAVGENRVTLVYKGMSTQFFIQGKKIQNLYVSNSRQVIFLGNMIDERDVSVTATYTDGSAETITDGITFIPEKLTELGSQEVVIQYKGLTASVGVTVQEAPELNSITLSYDGKGVKSDSGIKKRDLTVYAIYASGGVERLTTYNLDTPSIHDVGKGFIRVSYQGKTAEVEVNVEQKSIVALRAEYKGGVVELNRQFDYSDLYVYLVYDDEMEERTEDYVVYQRFIKYIGENTIKVYAKSLTTTFVVKGVEVKEPTFDYVSLFTIDNDEVSFDVATAIPAFIPESGVTGELVKNSKLRKIVGRMGIHETGQYIGFSYSFEEEDNEDELPLNVRISLPDEFQAEYTELYYSPNLKTIVAKMNKMDLIEENMIETTLFRAGTYILVYDPEAYITEEEEEEEEED